MKYVSERATLHKAADDTIIDHDSGLLLKFQFW